MSETIRRDANGQVLDMAGKPVLETAEDFRASEAMKDESRVAFNGLADVKNEVLKQPMRFSAPGKRDEGDRIKREMAAESYLQAAQESGVKAAEVRSVQRDSGRHFENNEEAYRVAGVELANADLEARGQEPVNLAGPGTPLSAVGGVESASEQPPEAPSQAQ